jgi:hypothetical protein
MATFSQLPGDLTITHTIGDEVAFTLDLDVDVTGYTFVAVVYVVESTGFQGGGGGVGQSIGRTAYTPTITIVNAAAGTLLWSASETQTGTGSLSTGLQYRHYVRWVTPAGVTRTVVSGDYLPKAP